MSAVMFFDFSEAQNVSPSDRVATLGDLGLEGPLQPAAAVQGWTGGGRRFTQASSHGFVAADNDGADSLRTRDVSVQAIVAINLAGAAGPMTLICRGTDGSASEFYAYGIEFEPSATVGDVNVRWFWMDLAGAVQYAAAATFTSPGDGKPFLFTATRRWESTSRVVCRYYAADHRIAEVVSTAGSIGGGTTGRTSIGARKTAGTWGRFFSGTIEQLGVFDYEISLEEIEATWRRLTVHQPEGVIRFRASSPPGVPWSRDPSSTIGRMIKVWGHLAGGAAAAAEQLEDMLPDRAYGDALDRWLNLVALSPRPLDSVDTRRERVLAFLQRENGYSLPILRRVLAPIFDLAEDQVQILEFANRIDEDWSSLRVERWHVDAASGSFTVGSGKLRLVVTEGDTLSSADRQHMITSLPEGEHGAPANGVGTWIQTKIDSVAAWPTNASAIAGIYWWNAVTDDRQWIGVAKSGSNFVLAHRRKVGGVLSATTTLATFGASMPALYVRARRTASDTSMLVEWSTVGFAASLSSATITCAPDPAWAGIGASVDGIINAADIDVSFDDFACDAPAGRRAFAWYAYRNPALPGTPDMVGARLLVARYRPAHTHADAITSLSLLCGDPSSVCAGGPLGGF